MNHHDKPLQSLAVTVAVLSVTAVVALELFGPASATDSLTYAVLVIIALLSFMLILASLYMYSRPRLHTSVVKSIWSERHAAYDKEGQTFQDLNIDVPEQPMMRLLSGGTYQLDKQDVPSIHVGDMVTVRRRWVTAVTGNHWTAKVLGVIPAEKLRPAKKANN
ncbi:hypothetical protein EOL96_02195 [Candidatus Saccharibacteria bacterium]|nr:hypothetical protein [Candidatus Saccharibacteria bacterium]